MSIDEFFNKKYNPDNYNCAHFVCEVWEHLTGFDITNQMQGFLLPVKDRYFTINERRKFKKLNEPKNPCIVLMQRPKTPSHVAIFLNRKVLQITECGVELMPLEIATRGFSRIGFYEC